MAGRVFGAGANSQTTPSAGRIQWSAPEAQKPSAINPSSMSSLDQRVLKSFTSLDANSRNSTLQRLSGMAKSGNKDAQRKLSLLVPEQSNNLPQADNFAPKDFGSKLGAALYGIGKGVVDSGVNAAKTIVDLPTQAAKSTYYLAKGDVAGAAKSQNESYINKKYGSKYAGDMSGIGNAGSFALDMAGLKGGGSVVQAGVKQGLKTAAIKGGAMGATYGAGYGVTQSATNNEQSVGRVFGNIATNAAIGGALGAGIPAVIGGTKGIAKGVQKYMDNPIEQAAYSRVKATGATFKNPLAEQRAISKEIKIIKSDPLQVQAIKDTYKTSGVKSITAETGKAVDSPTPVAPTTKLVAPKPESFYHGTASGNKFSAFDSKNANRGVGSNAFNQGDVTYLTPDKNAAGYFSMKANESQTLRNAGPDFNGVDNKLGEVYKVDLKPGSKIAKLDHTPSRDEIAKLKAQGYDGARFQDDAWKNVDDWNNDVLGSYDNFPKNQETVAIFNTNKLAIKHPAPATANKAVHQTVDETLSTPDATSRAKQYDASLQKTITGIEKSPGYQAELAAKGGGEGISNKEIYGKAQAAGPLDHQVIKDWQAGAPVDSVTLVRAKATLDVEARAATSKWDSGKLSAADLDASMKELAQLEAGYHVMSAEPGRATQIQGSFIDEAYKRAQTLRRLMSDTQGPNRDALIKTEMAAMDKAATQAGKTGVLSKEAIHSVIKMVEEYATAMKLTSPLTHAINIVSNFFTLPIKGVENLISVGIGTAQGKTTMGQLKYTFGTKEGIKSAVSQLVTELKQGVNPRAKDLGYDAGKLEGYGPAIPGVAGKVIRTPFNLLQAGDNFFKTILRDSETHQRAFEKAHQEGFKGAALDSRISELVANPTTDIIAAADKVAKEFTFTTELGPAAKAASTLISKLPFGKLLVPFISTPTNIVKFQLQRHPVGIFTPRNLNALMKGSNLERRDAVARLVVGTGMATGGLMAAFQAKDNITGAAPKDPGEKDLFYAQGKKPFSIKIGDRWVNYNRFQPVGLYLSQAVGVRDALIAVQAKNNKKGIPTTPNDLGPLFIALANTTASSISDLPFVSGVSGSLELLNNPTEFSFNRVAGSALAGLFPNIGRDIATASDGTQRNARTISDQVKLMIPGQRQSIAPRIGADGKPQVNAGSPLERGFLKITSKPQTNKLLEALTELGNQTGYYPDQPKITSKVQGRTLTTTEFAKYQDLSTQKFGSKLASALNDSSYQNLNKDDKQATIEKAVRDARSQAAEELFGKANKTTARTLKKY